MKGSTSTRTKNFVEGEWLVRSKGTSNIEFIRTCGGSSQFDLIQNYFLFLRNNCPKLGFSFATREGEIEREEEDEKEEIETPPLLLSPCLPNR